LAEIRAGIDYLEWAQMITFEVRGWDNVKGGMRFAFPPYELRAEGIMEQRQTEIFLQK
jgi:hypothetical protein